MTYENVLIHQLYFAKAMKNISVLYLQVMWICVNHLDVQKQFSKKSLASVI